MGSHLTDMPIHDKMSSSTCSKARSHLKPIPDSKFSRPGRAPTFRPALATAIASVNRSSADTVLLVVGDRTGNDEVSYPDIDMHLQPLPDGARRFTRKDGTPY